MNKMTVCVKTSRLLEALRDNKRRHAAIVAEARVGYVEQAQEALTRKLNEIHDGRIVGLMFHLNPPEDHTKDYDTAIQMLEWQESDEIEISAEDFRRFVEDDWDWRGMFLHSNKGYSATAALLSEDS